MNEGQLQDLSRFQVPKAARGRPAWFVQLWWIVDAIAVRNTPQALYAWRRFVWRLFGARVGRKVLIRPGARVTFPWKLAIGDYSWVGDDARLYNIEEITIGAHCVISQEAYLCAATHDHCDVTFPLVAWPIRLESECWVAARAFVGPGVTIGRGAVVGACSVVVSDVSPGMIVAGAPARLIGPRSR